MQKTNSTRRRKYPPRWRKYCAEVRGGHFKKFDFPANITSADVNRFAARYRAARAFSGVKIDGYKDATAEGYSGLFSALLTWSAFERFYTIVHGTKQGIYEYHIPADEHENLVLALKKNGSCEPFFQYVHDESDPGKARKGIASILDEGSGAVKTLSLAGGIRHIFGHGYLTPNANNSKPEEVAEICQLICGFLFKLMDDGFRRKIDQALDSL